MRNECFVLCDECHTTLLNGRATTEKDVIKSARKAGWSCGKKDLCPECRTSQPSYRKYEMISAFPEDWNASETYEIIRAKNKSHADSVAWALCKYRFGKDFQENGISYKVQTNH